MRISSGAGHDAQVLATKVPSAMIFVPSVEGRSHCPEELTLDSDIEKGSLLLLETLLSLAQ
jgi:N-carbamoyl-L-amino-acid hydrolase